VDDSPVAWRGRIALRGLDDNLEQVANGVSLLSGEIREVAELTENMWSRNQLWSVIQASEAFKRTGILTWRLSLCKAGRLVSRPRRLRLHIVLSQLSDLTDLPGQERNAIRDLLKIIIETIEEQYDPAKQLVNHPLFKLFGLGDASIAALVSEISSC